jgi:hypothetical protein
VKYGTCNGNEGAFRSGRCRRDNDALLTGESLELAELVQDGCSMACSGTF